MDEDETAHELNPSGTQEADKETSSPDNSEKNLPRRQSSRGDQAVNQESNEMYEGKTKETTEIIETPSKTKGEVTVDEVIINEERQLATFCCNNSENDDGFVHVVVPGKSAGKETQSNQEDVAGAEKPKSTENIKLVTDSQRNQNSGVDKEDLVIDTELSEQGETESAEDSEVPVNTNECISVDPWVKVDRKGYKEGEYTKETEARSITLQKENTSDLSNVQANYTNSAKATDENSGNKTHSGCVANDPSVQSMCQQKQPQQHNIVPTEHEAEKEETTENGEKVNDSPLKTCSTGDDNDHNLNVDISSANGSEETELTGDEKEKEHNTSAEEDELEFKNQLDSLSLVNAIDSMESNHPLSEKTVSEQSDQKELEILKAENERLKKEIEESKLQLDRNRGNHQQEIETLKTQHQSTLQQKEKFWSETFESMTAQIEKSNQHQLRLQKENADNMEHIGDLQATKEATLQINESLKKTIVQMEKDIKRLENDKEKEVKKRNDQIKDLTQKLASEKDRQKAVQKFLNDEKENVKQMQTKMTKMSQHHKTEWTRREHEYYVNMEKRKLDYENMIRIKEKQWEDTQATLNQNILEQRNVHEALLMRYSKLAGETLTVGNANVTDLSDPNRPTKLAEQFSELYDNEWTDAFEALSDINDLEKISYLLLILQRAYELSSEITSSYWLYRCYYTTFTNYKDAEINFDENDFEVTHPRACHGSADAVTQPPEAQTEVHENQSAESGTETVIPAVDVIDEINEKQKIENDGNADLSDKENTSSEYENQGRNDEDNFEENPEDNTVFKNDHDSNHEIEEKLDPTNEQQTIGYDGDRDNKGKRDPVSEVQTMKNEDTVGKIAADNSTVNNDQQRMESDDNHYKQNEENHTSGTDFQAGSSVDPSPETNVDSTQAIAEGTAADPVSDTTMENKEPVRRGKLNSLEGTDFQAGSSVDPSPETNVDSTQAIAEGTSADPVTNTTMKNKEPVRRGKLNSLEVPDKESKNEREQQTIKLFTHIKKKVLSSASTQLQRVITDCLVKELSIPTQAETAVMVFLKKCSEVCLMMGLKDPPLYIDFMKEGISDQTLFSAEQYKAYTRKGKYLEYVVWPCLFLEKDGPLLSKGTAQGRND